MLISKKNTKPVLFLCARGAGFSCPEASSGSGQRLTSPLQSLQPKIRNSLLVTVATIQFSSLPKKNGLRVKSEFRRMGPSQFTALPSGCQGLVGHTLKDSFLQESSSAFPGVR